MDRSLPVFDFAVDVNPMLYAWSYSKFSFVLLSFDA